MRLDHITNEILLILIDMIQAPWIFFWNGILEAVKCDIIAVTQRIYHNKQNRQWDFSSPEEAKGPFHIDVETVGSYHGKLWTAILLL